MTATTTIDALIDRVQEAAAGDKNAQKGNSSPALTIAMEEPIGWTVLFDFDARRYFSDPEFYLEQNLRQKLWRFENIEDDVPITLDLPAWLGHYPEYTFLGMDVTVTDRGVPVLQTDHPLTREPDVSLLEPVDFQTSGWMPRALKWHQDLCEIAAGRLNVSFIIWNRGGLDLAVQLRGYNQFCLDTLERPQLVHDLMKFVVEQRNRWYTACAAHFGEEVGVTWIADDWIGAPYTSPAMFEEFVLPRYLEIEAHHGGIGSVHSCGDQTDFQRHLLQIESLSALEVSPWTDLTQTLVNVPPGKHLQFSAHPNDVLVDSPGEMEAKLRFIAESCQGRSYGVGTSGLTPIHEDKGEFVHRINQWLDIGREAFRPS